MSNLWKEQRRRVRLNNIQTFGRAERKIDPVKERETQERKTMQMLGLSVDFQENFMARSVERDKEFALRLLQGWTLKQAAGDVGMTYQAGEILLSFPTFKVLLNRLRREAEDLVYGEDPDQMTESLARGNVWALRQVRDNPRGRDADKLRAALVLHEMRPTVQERKRKQEESGVRVSFSDDVMERMQEGLRRIKPQEVIEVTSQPVPPSVGGGEEVS